MDELNTTPALGLTLPGENDWADIEVLNENARLTDAAAGTLRTDLELHRGDLGNPHRVTAEQAGAEKLGAIGNHNADPGAHGDLRGQVSRNTTEIEALKAALLTDVNKNPFSVTFTTLEGVEMTGVWNRAQARVEF